MASWSSREDETLMETMLMPFFKKSRPINSAQGSEIDLKKILSGQGDDFDDDEEIPSAVVLEEPPLEVLFSREAACSPNDSQSLTAPVADVWNEAAESKKSPFHQTRNKYYRKFMEEVNLAKYCANKILGCLEDTKVMLEQNVEIQSDPGFGRVPETKAWVWILKETILSASLKLQNEKKERKLFNAFLDELISCVEQHFCKFLRDIKTVYKTFEKVSKEIQNLVGKSVQKFHHNMENAIDYELQMSGYHFLTQGNNNSVTSAKEGDDVMLISGITANEASSDEANPGYNLEIRCNVDGVTLRTGNSNSSWIKFQKIDQYRDIQLLLTIFSAKLIEPCRKIQKNLARVHELLNVKRPLSRQEKHKVLNDSVLLSILKCQEILDIPKTEVNYFPMEETIMLYTLKTTKAAFELIEPLLAEFVITAENRLLVVQEFTKQKKQLKRGMIGNRFPTDLNARFNLTVKNTNINTDIILNRYPNIRDARDLKEKLLKRFSEAGKLNDAGINQEPPVDVLYQRPSESLSTKSTPELMQMFRQLITKERNIINPNPAPYLFTDIERQYAAITKELAASRTITPEIITLCSHPIAAFYQAAVEMSSFKDKILTQLVYANQNLTCGHSGKLGEKEKIASVSSWIQVLCKILHIWNFHALQKHLQKSFLVTNDASLKWITKLEDALGKFTAMVKKYKQELYEFQSFIETHHGFTTWIKRSFRFNPPGEIIHKWSKEDPNDDVEFREMEINVRNEQDYKPASDLQIQFRNLDMVIVKLGPESDTPKLISLKKSSGKTQVGLVSCILTHMHQIICSAIVNLNAAIAVHEKHISLKHLQRAICSEKKLGSLKYIHQLEDLVLALTFEKVGKDLKETIAYVGMLNSTIGELNGMFEAVQMYMVDRGILKGLSAQSAKSEEGLQGLWEDKYLNETLQILKSSVDAMPNVFEIKDDKLKQSLIFWTFLAEQDVKLMDAKSTNFVDSENVQEEEDQVGTEESRWPISLESAMVEATNGKAFFPNPDLFPLNLESWRSFCFEMLSMTICRFSEITTSKINDTKITLSSPKISQTSFQEKTEHQTPTETVSVGYTEGLCYLLCILAEHLSPEDRLLISNDDLKMLKAKFKTAANAISSFKRNLISANKVLVNNLSLSMAKVECKKLPHYLPVVEHQADFLKSHDLKEVGPRQLHKELLKDVQKFGPPSGETQDNCVQIQWDSSNKGKVLCRESKDSDSNGVEFSEMHIANQLRLMHLIIDEVTIEFEKAAQIVHVAKYDLAFAKKLLEKTWQGISKDLKRRRMPASSIVVMLKLYRHQVDSAVVSMKAIRTTTEQVNTSLSQAAYIISLWANGKSNSKRSAVTEQLSKNNYRTSLNHLSLSVSLNVNASKRQTWILQDDEKVGTEIDKPTKTNIERIPLPLQKLERESFVEIKGTANVSSSTSVINLEQAPIHFPCNTKSDMDAVNLNASSLTSDSLDEIENEKDDSFHAAAGSIQNLIMTALNNSAVLVSLPNPHSSGFKDDDQQEIPNLLGILTALASVAASIRFFSDVIPDERSSILQQLVTLVDILAKIQRDGLLDTISTESEKIKKNVQLINANFRNKFCSDDKPPPMENISVSFQPTFSITPESFLESFAASIRGHVWTIVCGMPDLHTIIKNNKTLESHAVENIPLSSQVEVLISIAKFLENIMSHVQLNLQSSKQDLNLAKSMLKSKGKEIAGMSSGTKKWLLGIRWRTDNKSVVMSKEEIDGYLRSFARINNACVKAHEHVQQISDMLQKASQIVQQVVTYISLKFKLEPSVGAPNIDTDTIMRAQNWQTVDAISGIASPPNVPPPLILKKITKKSQKQEIAQMKYKTAWENRALELKVCFDLLCKENNIAINVPIVFAPVSIEDVEDYEN